MDDNLPNPKTADSPKSDVGFDIEKQVEDKLTTSASPAAEAVVPPPQPQQSAAVSDPPDPQGGNTPPPLDPMTPPDDVQIEPVPLPSVTALPEHPVPPASPSQGGPTSPIAPPKPPIGATPPAAFAEEPTIKPPSSASAHVPQEKKGRTGGGKKIIAGIAALALLVVALGTGLYFLKTPGGGEVRIEASSAGCWSTDLQNGCPLNGSGVCWRAETNNQCRRLDGTIDGTREVFSGGGIWDGNVCYTCDENSLDNGSEKCSSGSNVSTNSCANPPTSTPASTVTPRPPTATPTPGPSPTPVAGQCIDVRSQTQSAEAWVDNDLSLARIGDNIRFVARVSATVVSVSFQITSGTGAPQTVAGTLLSSGATTKEYSAEYTIPASGQLSVAATVQ